MKMHTKIGLGVSSVLLATGGLTAVTTVAADAHTPSGGADCEKGVWAQGLYYEARDYNTLTVYIDGAGSRSRFEVNGYLSQPIPQDGVEHTFSWSVETTNPNPRFSAHGSGVITCGEAPPPPPPPPPPAVKNAWFHLTRYCNTVRVEGRHNVASITQRHHGRRYVFIGHAKPHARFGDGNAWVKKVRWTKTGGACHSGDS